MSLPLLASSPHLPHPVPDYLAPFRFLVANGLLTDGPPQYWDSITKEDLEFSVGTRMNNWEVKELLPEDELNRRNTVYNDDPYAQSSAFEQPYTPSNHRYSSRY